MGFTLIELLIVIALLGALAVGMLAAIDPLEQFKKGNDTTIRNTVEELYNSMIRYYAIKTEFPWETLGSGATFVSAVQATDALVTDSIDLVVGAGELKTDFIELATMSRLNNIWVDAPVDDSLVVCFQPTSKSFQADPNTKYTSAGSAYTTECTSQIGGSELCFWCLK